MIQGSLWKPTNGGPAFPPEFDSELQNPGEDNLIESCTFGASTELLARQPDTWWVPNRIQLSYWQKTRVLNNTIYYPAHPSNVRQAIQAWEGVEVEVRGNTFLRFPNTPHPDGPPRAFPTEQTLVNLGNYAGEEGTRESVLANAATFGEDNRYGPS
jgi:hypothetical protein